MTMKMLEAGGVPLLTDGVRPADSSNPLGYFEYEPVRHLATGTNPVWLRAARGKAVKIISFLLAYLPEDYDFRVIFLQRDLAEVLASQQKLLEERDAHGAAATDDTMSVQMYEDHLQQVERLLAGRRCFTVLPLNYRAVLESPLVASRRIADFIGKPLNVKKMASVVNPALYRNRDQR